MSGCWLLVVALALLAGPAHAHVVYGTRTLQGLVAASDLVLRARIVEAASGLSHGPEATGADRPQVEAEVLEVLKGSLEASGVRSLEAPRVRSPEAPRVSSPGAPRVRFVQHGHGVAQFEPGSEALVFLQRIGRSRELDALGRAGNVAWVSVQEHREEYALAPAVREPLLTAVRAYVAAGKAAAPEARTAALRRANLALLTSGDARLAASALRDLVAARQLPLLAAEDLPVLEPVLDDPGTSMGVRVALLAQLEQRGLIDGPPRWLQLLSAGGTSRDRVTAIRAAASSPDPAVRARLLALVGDPDAEIAAAAAVAVAAPGREAAVAPLTSALEHDSPRVRLAAVRGLGRIATPRAREALETAASASADPATRRHAQAELRKQRSF